MFSRMDKPPPSSPGGSPCGVWSALTVGLGSIIGGGVFATMGPAVQGAGGAAPLAFVLGALPAYVTACSYCRMARRYPGQGGTIAYFNQAFGGGYLSGSLNLLLVVCYACIASLYAGVFGVYLAELFHWRTRLPEKLLSSFGVFLVAWLNLSAQPWTKQLQGKLNVSKFLIMGVFMAAALLSPFWNWENFETSDWGSSGSILATGMTIFMSYQGFELLAAIRRPMKNPTRTLPLAMGLCLGIATLYYGMMAFCTVGNVLFEDVEAESGYLISAVAYRLMGSGGGILLCLGAVMASLSALDSDVFSVSSLPEQMADKKEMPTYFLPSHAGARALGVLFLCGLLLLFVNLVSVVELTAISSIGFLVIYALANLVSMKITQRTTLALLLGWVGCITCLAAAGVVIFQLSQAPHRMLLLSICGGMLALPFLWQGIYYLVRSRFLS